MNGRPEWYVPPHAGRTRLIIAGLSGLVVILAVISALAIAQAGPFGYSDSAKWSAVLLNDDEIFFGHLQVLQNDKLQLTNVYYVQTSKSGTNASPAIVSLVANQLQCPRDYVWIDRSSVRYWEDLQDNSFVVQQLNQLGTQPKNCVKPQPSTPAPSAPAPTPAASPTP